MIAEKEFLVAGLSGLGVDPLAPSSSFDSLSTSINVVPVTTVEDISSGGGGTFNFFNDLLKPFATTFATEAAENLADEVIDPVTGAVIQRQDSGFLNFFQPLAARPPATDPNKAMRNLAIGAGIGLAAIGVWIGVVSASKNKKI